MYGKTVALGLLLLTLPGITDARKTEPSMVLASWGRND